MSITCQQLRVESPHYYYKVTALGSLYEAALCNVMNALEQKLNKNTDGTQYSNLERSKYIK